MARRRLEAAILAGKAIAKGEDGTGPFGKVEVERTYPYHMDRDGVFSLQYSLNGQLLAVGFGDGGVEFLSSATGELHRQCQGQRCDRLKGVAVTCLRFSPVEHHVCYAGGADGKVRACSTIDGTSSVIVSEPGNEINCLDFRLDGANFATAGKDLDVRIYDTITHQEIARYEGYNSTGTEQSGHSQRIFALRYHPDHNNVLVTGGWDNYLKIWDTRTESGVTRRIPGPHVCGDGLDIKNGQVLTGSWVRANALQLWDCGEGTLIKNVPFPATEHGEFLYCAQFCDRDTVLAGGSGTNSVQAINIQSGQVVGCVQLQRPVQAMDSTRGGRRFAVAGMDVEVKMAAMF